MIELMHTAALAGLPLWMWVYGEHISYGQGYYSGAGCYGSYGEGDHSNGEWFHD